MILDIVVWWLVVEILGLAALPLALRVFRSLPDRGYAFAKPLGIFLVSYILWILTILGLTGNTRGTLLFIVVALLVASWWFGVRRPVASAEAKARRVTTAPEAGRAAKPRTRPRAVTPALPARSRPLPDVIAWLRANARLVAVEEMIFAAGLLIWGIFKAYNPEITATEKPMEFAFLTAILRSEQFPPLDPWLSGYSISYYYFGYLMMAVLTRLSGLAASVGYNLTLVLMFALTLSGAFSVVYALVAHRLRANGLTKTAAGFGLLGAFFVTVMGNLQGFLELLYSHGIGSQAFWASVGIAEMAQPYTSASWYPTANWWWWKATRVVGTQGPIGDYTINEFPFFSFMLGDNHPHVLALPFVLMALALGLSVLLGQAARPLALWREQRWLPLAGVWLAPALLLGGLFFLNSWDFPTYVLITVLAYGLRLFWQQGKLDRDDVKDWLLFAAPIAVLGVLLYLPFYISFQSQAGGIGVVRVRSQLHHFLLIWLPFLLMAAGFLAVKWREWRTLPEGERNLGRAWQLPLFIVGLLLAVAMVALQVWTAVSTLLFTSLIAGVLVSLMLLALLLGACFLALSHRRGDVVDLFVLLVIGVGLLATLGPEWLHIKDTFGGNLTRMNTVFKYYYQAWLLLGVASAYSVFYVMHRRPAQGRPGFARLAWLGAVVVVLLLASYYPLAAYYTKAGMFKGAPTLDGAAYIKSYAPDEYEAIQWLNTNVSGAPVILEAVGGEYSEFARISTHTGLPTVLGWAGHEVQWRGNAKGWESREGDVDKIYATTDAATARNLLAKYNVTYVYVGRLERESRAQDGKPRYDPAALSKFSSFMDIVYQKGGVTIYKTRG